MASRGRSVTPSRRYGDIIGSIISNGSGELEEKKKTSVSLVKQKFRERRRKSSPARSVGSNSVDEQRQHPSSPHRNHNETRQRSRSRPPTPDRKRSSSRPPTPDRKRSSSRPPTPDRNSNRKSFFDDSPSESSKEKPKGISLRSLSISLQKRRVRVVDSPDSSGGNLTDRVREQVSKTMKKTTEGDQQVVGTKTPGLLKQSPKYQASQTNKEQKQERSGVEQNSESPSQPQMLEGSFSTRRTGRDAGASSSYSTGDSNQIKDIIMAQNEQIKFFEGYLMKRSNDIEQLTLELKLSKKNESRLSLELEMHDLKYSMYDDYRRMMDRQRLKSKSNNDGSDDEEEEDPTTSFFRNSNVAFVKLDQLDRLYESSKLEAESRFSILRDEYNRISSMKSIYDDGASIDSTDKLPTTTDFLEKRIKILEAENLKNSLAVKEMEEELKKAKSMQIDAAMSRKEENRFYGHNLEKRALQNKIVALETEIGFTSGHVDDKTRTRRYRALEKNLDDYVTEIMGLEDQLKEKEKIIAKLKERDIEMSFGSDERNNLDSDWSIPSGKWYEKSNHRRKGETVHKGRGLQTSKSLDYDNMEAASTVIVDNRRRTVSPSRSYKMGIKRGVNKRRASESSARIAMLRKRLDALASDHYSVGTEETQRSSQTTPS